jgi:hypothetical protein
MKQFGILLVMVCGAAILFIIGEGIRGAYEYKKSYLSYWNLADKSSTIVEKSHYIDLFVEKLEESGMDKEYDAIWFKTIDNSFDSNLIALKSLQQ